MKISFGTYFDKMYIIKNYSHTLPVLGKNGTLIVAKNDYKQIVGFLWCFYRIIPAPIGEISEVFINAIEVFEETQRCKGIGSALVQKCIEKAKNEGAFQVRAYCEIDNVSSHKLWLKNKFGISPVKMQDGNFYGSYVTYVL